MENFQTTDDEHDMHYQFLGPRPCLFLSLIAHMAGVIVFGRRKGIIGDQYLERLGCTKRVASGLWSWDYRVLQEWRRIGWWLVFDSMYTNIEGERRNTKRRVDPLSHALWCRYSTQLSDKVEHELQLNVAVSC